MTGYLVSVDPGVHAVGIAFFIDRRLCSAAYVGGEWRGHRLPQVAFDAVAGALPRAYEITLVVEVPQVYGHGGAGKGEDPNDLIDLALVVGAFVGYLRPVALTIYRPREWKGQVPKDVMTRRIKEKLAPEEVAKVRLPARGKQHNVWDAVGIGLKKLGRL